MEKREVEQVISLNQLTSQSTGKGVCGLLRQVVEVRSVTRR